MALIVMAVYDTAENKRSELTERTLDSLYKTVDFSRHDIIIVNNNSCPKTENIIDNFIYRVIEFKSADVAMHLKEKINHGTAKAINIGWSRRKPGQHCIKIDNDVVIHSEGWADELEEAVAREPKIGIIGLKRKDLIESTTYEAPEYRSHLIQLAHSPGQRWIVIEAVKGVMGTCKLVNCKLMEKIGYLYQPTVYGFDDSLYSCRSSIAGFINCFLPHIEIDHIDPGGTEYTDWKAKHAGQIMNQAQTLIAQYESGERDIYEKP